MYRVTPKRNGYIVQEKSNRKQHGPVFKKKTEAENHRLKLMTDTTVAADPKITLHTEFKSYAKRRLEQAEDPDNRLTIKGVQGYLSDWNNRISKYLPDVPLAQFTAAILRKGLVDATNDGQSYKSLRRTVRNLKTFIRQMIEDGKNPCQDILAFKIQNCFEIHPVEDKDFYEHIPEVIQDGQVNKLLRSINENKFKNENSALRFAIFSLSALFGLRRSEMAGLKKSHVDLENGYLHIRGMYDYKENELRNRTKNRGSKRSIELTPSAVKFLELWLDYLHKHSPYSSWLLPANRGSGPVSSAHISDLVWQTYAEAGLAKIEKRSGHIVVIESPFKHAPLKTFRHRVATQLINSMNTNSALNANYVKSVIGHSRFATTRDRYGNHALIGSDAEREARIAAREKALNLKI